MLLTERVNITRNIYFYIKFKVNTFFFLDIHLEGVQNVTHEKKDVKHKKTYVIDNCLS